MWRVENTFGRIIINRNWRVPIQFIKSIAKGKKKHICLHIENETSLKYFIGQKDYIFEHINFPQNLVNHQLWSEPMVFSLEK